MPQQRALADFGPDYIQRHDSDDNAKETRRQGTKERRRCLPFIINRGADGRCRDPAAGRRRASLGVGARLAHVPMSR